MVETAPRSVVKILAAWPRRTVKGSPRAIRVGDYGAAHGKAGMRCNRSLLPRLPAIRKSLVGVVVYLSEAIANEEAWLRAIDAMAFDTSSS